MSGGLISAYLLDGKGGGTPIDWDGIARWSPQQGLLWVHLDHGEPKVQAWLADESGLDEVVAEALLAEETRPRSVVSGEGLMAFLRGVNLNPGAQPEDMISMRLWLERDRIITLRHRRLMSVDDLRNTIARGSGPRTTGEFLAEISDRLVTRAADVIADIDETVDALEDEIVTAESRNLRPLLAGTRRRAIALRRYLAPQREAMARLAAERAPWLEEAERMRLREVADRVTRYVEALDAARERAAITQEELTSRLSEQMNARMYVLSLVAGLFLPLSFITGMLGVNVGGVPGADNPWGFVILCVLIAAIGGTQIALFHIKRWI